MPKSFAKKFFLKQKQKLFVTFLPFCLSIFKVSASVQELLRQRKIFARAIVPPNDAIIERVLILAPVYHSRSKWAIYDPPVPSTDEGSVREEYITYSLATGQ